MQRMLDQHPSISCGSESFILESLYQMERRRWIDLTVLGITQSEWRAHVRELFSWVQEQRARAKGKVRWADKTPTYALILDFIDDLYPDCQVIHVIRDPLDVIDSWRRRVGNRKARQAVQAWPEHIRAARAFRDTHSSDRYIEIRYEDLVSKPEKVMRPVVEWLGEPWDDGVLHLPPRKRARPLEPAERTRRQRARWLGNPIEDDSSESDTAESRDVTADAGSADSSDTSGNGKLPGSDTSTERGASSDDTPVSQDRWPFRADPNMIVSSSVGVGSRGKSLLVNAPYLIQLERIAGPLVRELGYGRPLTTYWEAVRSIRAK